MVDINISVLFIDDNIQFAMVAKEYLGTKGITIKKIISNTYDALKEVENNFYDIIIIDMNLDDNMYAGLDIIKSIKSMEDIGFIVVTGHNNTSLMLGTLKFGILRYLQKPFDLSLLYAHVLDLAKTKMKDKENNVAMLTRAEKELLDYISKGLSRSKIANISYKSVETIKSQTKSIKKKLNVNNHQELIKISHDININWSFNNKL